MYAFGWKYFPARLHTTKEMIYFLENNTNIKDLITTFPKDLVNGIFNRLYSSTVRKKTKYFLERNYDYSKFEHCLLEICSRKVYFYKDNIPVNAYYVGNNKHLVNQFNLQYKELTDDEIEKDIQYIIELIKKKFSKKSKLVIITHVNLKIKNKYIEKRAKLVKLLEKIAEKYKISIINPGKIMENKFKNDCPMRKIMKGDHYRANMWKTSKRCIRVKCKEIGCL
jgi:hypothetical protein